VLGRRGELLCNVGDVRTVAVQRGIGGSSFCTEFGERVAAAQLWEESIAAVHCTAWERGAAVPRGGEGSCFTA
jgi:hypothetical protein